MTRPRPLRLPGPLLASPRAVTRSAKGTRRRLAATVVAVLFAASALAACSTGGGGYRLTAVFERTVGLYEGGDVYVMGVPVGTVDSIEIDGTVVRVELSVDDGVPLPADVQATIGQTQLIGERNVVLFPPWDAEMAAAGRDRAADGDMIPLARTQVPVEPDEGLQAFNDLAQGLDADVVSDLVSDSADVLDGRGEQLGAAIDQAAGLGTTLAEIDQQLLAAADDLHRLAGTLAERDQQLGQLVDRFSQVTGALSDERQGIADLLTALVELTDVGGSLLDRYGDQLPGDIASATALASILEQNTAALDQLVRSLPGLSEGIGDAYQEEIDGFFLRASGGPTVNAILEAVDVLGLLPDDLLR